MHHLPQPEPSSPSKKQPVATPGRVDFNLSNLPSITAESFQQGTLTHYSCQRHSTCDKLLYSVVGVR